MKILVRPRAARSSRAQNGPIGCRRQTPEEKAKVVAEHAADAAKTMEDAKLAHAKRMAARRSRGMGTVVGASGN